ncbi:MAG: hypothetical protein MI867_28495 [Pseudomonadales bacterium]|nr:hypothetical protein [Pseudomonadales bacterium]
MDANAHLLTDLGIDLFQHKIRPVYRVGDVEKRLPAGRGGVKDIRIVEGRNNLGQAILMRLLTPMGELAGLGHADYGSRLTNLVGEVNTETTRNLARLYILESLKKEPRVEKVILIKVSEVFKQPSMISIELEVKPVDSTDTVTIGPFTLNLS